MEIAGDTCLEFLDLKLKISEDKIRVDVLTILHVIPTIQKTRYATYLEVQPVD